MCTRATTAAATSKPPSFFFYLFGTKTHTQRSAAHTTILPASPRVSSLHNTWSLLKGGGTREGRGSLSPSLPLPHKHWPAPLCSLGQNHLTAVAAGEIPALFTCLLFTHLSWLWAISSISAAQISALKISFTSPLGTLPRCQLLWLWARHLSND